MSDDFNATDHRRASGVFDLPENDGVNESERLLTALCRRSFLRLWAYPNLFTDEDLRGGKGSSKEFSDALVVFGRDVLIFSDKQIKFQENKELTVAWKRWYRSAIADSFRQLCGAKSWVMQFPDRLFLDAKCTRRLPITIPAADTATYHLIAVTRGARAAAQRHFNDEIGSFIISTDVEGEVQLERPFTIGRTDSKRGFVHVFDEAALEIVMAEFDTAADFITYLRRREALLSSRDHVVITPGEEQLVAAYLSTLDREDEHCFVRFDEEPRPNVLYFDESHYRGLQDRPEYRHKKHLDQESRFWDELIERFVRLVDPSLNPLGEATAPQEIERALRTIAAESRFRRRLLVETIRDAAHRCRPGMRFVRMYRDPGVPDSVYIFLFYPKGDDQSYEEYRLDRRSVLHAYCRIAKLQAPASNVFVGLGFDHPACNYQGSSEDLLIWEQVVWDAETQRELEQEREELGFWGPQARITQVSAQEFPNITRAPHRAADLHAMFAGLAHPSEGAPKGKRPPDKKRRDKLKAQAQRRNRRKK